MLKENIELVKIVGKFNLANVMIKINIFASSTMEILHEKHNWNLQANFVNSI